MAKETGPELKRYEVETFGFPPRITNSAHGPWVTHADALTYADAKVKEAVERAIVSAAHAEREAILAILRDYGVGSSGIYEAIRARGEM